VPGSNVSKVTLSPEAVLRIGVQTAPVAERDLAPAQRRKIIPYAAVLYDRAGTTWTYTNPQALVYMRERITVESIQGDTAILTEGPAAGTAVVTVGGAELYGAELGVGK
jgi:hypothetical protein